MGRTFEGSTESRLLAFQASELHSPQELEKAKLLHEQLTRPKQVTLMGPPGVGKANVMSLLAGRSLLTESLNVGHLKYSYGTSEKTTITLQNGTEREFDCLPNSKILPDDLNPKSTEVFAPLPSLKKISLLQMAEVNDMDGQIAAINWAANRSDAIIWCTSKFTKIEKNLWSYVPAKLQKSAIVLASALEAHDLDRDIAVAFLKARAGSEFGSFQAVDLRRAFSASASVPVDKAGMRASGASDLISSLLKEIDSDRREARDDAKKFLAKVEPGKVATPVETHEPSESIAEVDALVESGRTTSRDLDTDDAVEARAAEIAAAIQARVEDDWAKKDPQDLEPEIFPTIDPSVPRPTRVIKEEPKAQEVFSKAIVLLEKVGADHEGAEVDVQAFFGASQVSLLEVNESLAALPETAHPKIGQLKSMAENIVDLVQLLRAEPDQEEAGVEVTLAMLQLKRSLQASVSE